MGDRIGSLKQVVRLQREIRALQHLFLAYAPKDARPQAWIKQIHDGCDGHCALEECICAPEKV
jgi:hypothetical protein